MATITLVWPILPGKSEVWRRLTQELLGWRRGEYEESRCRLGITREVAWIVELPQAELVIVSWEVEDPAQVIQKLAASDHPFDRWFRQQLLEIHGIDVTRLPAGQFDRPVLEWPESP
jgi:hypothetical protein